MHGCNTASAQLPPPYRRTVVPHSTFPAGSADALLLHHRTDAHHLSLTSPRPFVLLPYAAPVGTYMARGTWLCGSHEPYMGVRRALQGVARRPVPVPGVAAGMPCRILLLRVARGSTWHGALWLACTLHGRPSLLFH